jgi:predicted methyltransferase
MKRSILLGAAFALAVAAPAFAAKHAAATPKYIADAVAQTTRPADQTALDAERKPAETVLFAGVKPGSKVMDLVPGRGYFTRIFSGVVGDKGWVYAYLPTETDAFVKKAVGPDVDIGTLFNSVPHTSTLHNSIMKISAPEPLDIVFTAQNYHDFHDSFFGPADLAVVNKSIYDVLKPGGYFVVIDHSAEKGSGLRDTEKLHRIDEATLKQEVEAAGFKLVAEANFLRNPKDPRDKLVFDPSIRHNTDQFVLKFQKPKK